MQSQRKTPLLPPPPCLTLLLIYLWSLSGCDSKQCLFFPGNHLLQACFRMYPGFQSAGCLSSLCSQFPSLKLRQTHPGIFCLGFSTRSNFPLLTPPPPPSPLGSHTLSGEVGRPSGTQFLVWNKLLFLFPISCIRSEDLIHEIREKLKSGFVARQFRVTEIDRNEEELNSCEGKIPRHYLVDGCFQSGHSCPKLCLSSELFRWLCLVWAFPSFFDRALW